MPLIEKDPGLCADILHTANSAFYGLRSEVESIHDAVRFIGFSNIVDLVSMAFSNQVIRNDFGHIEDLNEYFKHSNDIAVATKILAKCAGKSTQVQEFYTIVGLLHDIGRLVLISVSNEDTLTALNASWDEHMDFTNQETNIYGMNHCKVGEEICRRWEFSPCLQRAILKHHSPFGADYSEEAAFTLLAHFIAMEDFPLEQLLEIYPQDDIEKMYLTNTSIIQARNMYQDVR